MNGLPLQAWYHDNQKALEPGYKDAEERLKALSAPEGE